LSHKAQNDICRQFKDVVQRFSGRAVMKDSFCQMDAQSEGLEVLFDASWIWFGKDKQRPSCTWKRVKSNSDLQLWQDAWKQSGFPTDVKMFNETFLNKEDIFIFGQKNSGVFEKGCIGNRSRNCIGYRTYFPFLDRQGFMIKRLLQLHLLIRGCQSWDMRLLKI
ncbi:MAG: hypothetical protein P8J84_04450, partial [Paracoccaceae bacterium]|nr:hypothetical protein [Paracoccaceae bacterium]